MKKILSKNEPKLKKSSQYSYNKLFAEELIKAFEKGNEFVILNDSLNTVEKEILSYFDSYIIGQQKAKRSLAKAILKCNKILSNEGVLATLFFAGPTGVGKTELAKVLTELLTGNRDNLIIIQGSEYQESHKIANLFGSPKGYVGYGDAPILSEINLFKKKLQNPHHILKNLNKFAIILVDEAEKMHPAIIQSLLGALNEGKVTLSTGKEDNPNLKYSKFTDLTNTIWIFTSNVGSKIANQKKTKSLIGFGSKKEKLDISSLFENEFKKYFSPEFRGRIDYFVTFNELTDNDIDKIIHLNLLKANSKLKEKGFQNLEVQLSKDLVEFIKKTADINLGARNVVKLFNKIVEDQLVLLNINDILFTANLIGYSNQKKIIIELGLKKGEESQFSNKNNEEILHDKINIKIKWGKSDVRLSSQEKKEIEKIIDDKLNLFSQDLLDTLSYHESGFEVINYLVNTFVNLFTQRENLGPEFQEKLKYFSYFILNTFGELDLKTLKFISYALIVKNFSILDDVDKIIDGYVTLDKLAKALGYKGKDYRLLLKNQIKQFKNKKYFLIRKMLNNVSNVNYNISLNKKESVISYLLMKIDSEYYAKREKYLSSKVLGEIATYLLETY